jgi:hypothetical protein
MPKLAELLPSQLLLLMAHLAQSALRVTIISEAFALTGIGWAFQERECRKIRRVESEKEVRKE